MQKRYVSPICLEAPNGWICTKFGLGVPFVDDTVAVLSYRSSAELSDTLAVINIINTKRTRGINKENKIKTRKE